MAYVATKGGEQAIDQSERFYHALKGNVTLRGGTNSFGNDAVFSRSGVRGGVALCS
jgi:hypothetical protein